MKEKKLDLRLDEPLYKQLSSILIQEIITGKWKPDDKFLTEREIQKKYNVSTTTVKAALTELVYKGLLYKRPGKGTFIKYNKLFAENYADNSLPLNNIVIVLPQTIRDASLNPFYSLVIEGIEEECAKNGFHLEIFILSETSEKYKILLSKIESGKLKYLFLISGKNIDRDFALKMKSKGIGIVFFPFSLIQDGISSVVIDDENGAFKAVEYLIKKGHKRIGFLGGGSQYLVTKLRLQGYKKALKKYNIPLDKNLIVMGTNMEFLNGFNNVEKLLKNKPTAIFAINDSIAIGAMKFMLANNYKIPDDVSIIGFDDIEMASQIHPSLTTMRINRKEMGQSAAQLMIELIKNKDTQPKEILISAELVERETVKSITFQGD